MSSLTAQESSESNPKNPVNEGTTSAPGTGSDPAVPKGTGKTSDSGFESGLSSKGDKISAGTQNASGNSEQRSGADLSQEGGDKGGKSGSESLLDSVEKSVHERGEGEHSRAV
ncbi:hypothetical protein BU25DRAFT_411613 [Macroventuria anomochaeta]|uniref:Uncharacterized protein n=1 Tax=Macroventuria anomochaeta TaxID=301207 RepID=A0ACB6RXN8_9PLEO|nr:uncharacterized protein BU25DRAFT_411613 [Macroventuria anomochaeta]KAF2626641.1 hypothetical protein BU25DRAFT_411613 [Macroventuria anomochaeta]